MKKILLLLIFVSFTCGYLSPHVYAKKPKKIQEPIIIDTQVLEQHKKLYSSSAIDIITYPHLELPILPQIFLDLESKIEYKIKEHQLKDLKN